jgi:ubiquinone/menaquinone biosynthesis C-methylase UbiE
VTDLPLKELGGEGGRHNDAAPPLRRLSQTYDEWHRNIFTVGESPDQGSPWYRLVLEYLVPSEGKRVLEVACGRGGFATLLASSGARVCGADFSAAALRIARAKSIEGNGHSPNVVLSQADAHALPFVSGVFDIVISCETIEHLTDSYLALREMARVCRVGGLLYLTTPNYLNLMGLYLIYDRVLRKDRRSPAAQPIDRRWWFPQVRTLVQRAGWNILKTDGTVHQLPFPGRNPLRLLSLEHNRKVRRLFSPLAFHYFILARKRES